MCLLLIILKLSQKKFIEARNFINKETLTQVFYCKFCGISKNTFFTEHIRGTASDMGSSFPRIQWRNIF